MTTEIIDKLFLELSEVTSATTKREIAIYMKLQDLRKAVEPFVKIVRESQGRIPIEMLSLENWHNLLKAFGDSNEPHARQPNVAEAIRQVNQERLDALGHTYLEPGSVISIDGKKQVIRQSRHLRIGEKFVCKTPHEDGDFSYCCGSDYCRCMQ